VAGLNVLGRVSSINVRKAYAPAKNSGSTMPVNVGAVDMRRHETPVPRP